ncbi:MAG: hypothetical protein MI922_19130 [Bacteroidales bacterium]|nr:hypothetical protein [Bacteroidales bacterium]
MTNKLKYKAKRLYPRTSFFQGMGSSFNIAGNYYEFNYFNSDIESDMESIKSDWGIIGNDIYEAMDKSDESILQPND